MYEHSTIPAMKAESTILHSFIRSFVHSNTIRRPLTGKEHFCANKNKYKEGPRPLKG